MGFIAITMQFDAPPAPTELKIGLVGPCAAGKTTLTNLLRARGLTIKPIAQEHSYVQQMWQIITKPDVLIFLEVSFENTILRRKLNWNQDEYNEQLRRLAHAHQHADLVIDTNGLTPEQVVKRILDFLLS